jgi:hypothetical protein
VLGRGRYCDRYFDLCLVGYLVLLEFKSSSFSIREGLACSRSRPSLR